MDRQHKLFSRAALAFLILLSGLAFMPFAGLSSESVGWQSLSGAYQADLNVDPDRGRPGSAFLFTASGFPPNQLGIIYVNGLVVGNVWIDGSGQAVFLIQTQADSAQGDYFVTLATGGNASATEDFRLENDEALEPPPDGYDGPVFGLEAGLYLPFFARS